MEQKYFKIQLKKAEKLTYFNYRNNENLDSPLIPIHIESVGKTYPDPHYYVKRANWNIYTIEFVVSGEGYLNYDGKNYHVKKGDIYILNKKSIQEYGADKTNPYEKIWINFRSDHFDCLLSLFNLLDTHIVTFPEGQYYLEQLFDLQNSYHCVEDASFPALNILFNLLSQISQLLRKQNDNVPPLIKKAAEYIDEKLMEPIKIKDVANHINVSTTCLIYLFKKYYKKTPYEYQLSNRLKTARLYIETTNKSLSEIADLCGFYDSFSLSKLFKKRYGISPRNARLKFSLPTT